jgi:hypothetical protein
VLHCKLARAPECLLIESGAQPSDRLPSADFLQQLLGGWCGGRRKRNVAVWWHLCSGEVLELCAASGERGLTSCRATRNID